MKPSLAQEEYAEALVQQLRDESQLSAESFARRVLHCQDKWEISQLISEMKNILTDLDRMSKGRLD